MTGRADDTLAELRREVAERYGLDEAAARFLTATSISELETQATDLARLLGVTSEPEPEEAGLAALFARPGPAKQRRQHQLAAVLTGRQPRDERGRFAARATASSMDAGPREPPPRPPPTHEEWLVGILRQPSHHFW